MKLSNIRNVRIKYPDRLTESIFADVDVTTSTGALWWKKTTVTQQTIHKNYLNLFWVFVETGEYTPERQAEQLIASWKAKVEMESMGVQ